MAHVTLSGGVVVALFNTAQTSAGYALLDDSDARVLVFLAGQTKPTLTARQFQLALESLGYLALVQAKVDAATPAQQIEWNERAVFQRDWSLMLTVIGATLSSVQLDAVFTAGKGF